MMVVVDVASGEVSLQEPAVFTAFHVANPSGATTADLAGVIGTDLPDAEDHVWVPIVLIRDLAGGDEAWESGFAGMLGYAGSKGWLSPDGQLIQAHVE